MKTAEKFYTINVDGGNATPAYEGKLDKEDNRPSGPVTEVFLQLGVKSIPNYSRVWARRILLKDKPTGKLEFLKWGDPAGEVVQIRYLPTSSSLDKLYQENVEKVHLNFDGDENAEIRLKVGLNKYDMVVNKNLVDMLQHHTFCGDNESRDPNNRTIVFYKHDGEARLENLRAEAKLRHEAESVVFHARDKDQLPVLASIFEIDRRESDNYIEELLMAKIQTPGDGKRILPGYSKFLNTITARKNEIMLMLSEAAEMEVLNGSDGGEVTVREEGKHVPLLPGVVQEGDSVVNFMIDNILSVQYFDASVRVGGALEVYKEVQLN